MKKTFKVEYLAELIENHDIVTQCFIKGKNLKALEDQITKNGGSKIHNYENAKFHTLITSTNSVIKNKRNLENIAH